MRVQLMVAFLFLVSHLQIQFGCSVTESPVQSGVEPQRCGTDNTKYYCPLDENCKDRINRCTLASKCVPEGGLEDKCFQSETGENAYTVYVGHAFPLAAGSSLPEHQFIQYRGFTYEFGPSFGVQILDVNDPNYKYRDNRNVTGTGVRNSGLSYCTWRDATLFVDRWMSNDYPLFAKKCEKFAAAMQWYLTHGICSDSTIIVKRQDRYDKLGVEINAILTDCNVICCNNTASSGFSVVQLTLLIVSIAIMCEEFFKLV